MRALPFALVALVAAPAAADETYRRPPKEIADILEAPKTPSPMPSPDGNAVALVQAQWYPRVADLAEPMLKLAGVRINPKNNGRFTVGYNVRMTVKNLPDGAELPVTLPAGARLGGAIWNAPGTMFAVTSAAATRVELWVVDAATGKARRLPGVRVNSILGWSVQWMPDQKTLLVKMVPPRRAAPPPEPAVPPGPIVEESNHVGAASSTYEARDLLRTPHDADLFDYYATAQLALVSTATGKVTPLGAPAVLAQAEAAPGGGHILVQRLVRPYSYIRPWTRFPAEIEVWDTSGKKLETVAKLPLAEDVPINGERVGPREVTWRSTAPATLVWTEALDGGDTYKKVPRHDKVVVKPVGSIATTLVETEQRFGGLSWIEGGGGALYDEVDLDKHWTRTFLVDADAPAGAPRKVFDRSYDDRYGDPGAPIAHTLPNGAWVIRAIDGAITLQGPGASPEGDRPFLDLMRLDTLKSERLFRADRASHEAFVTWVEPGKTFVTTRESPTEPPNLQLRSLGAPATAPPAGEAAFASTARPLTRYADPTPTLRKLSKKLVTYKRADGVPLSFTLYLPPDYKPGTRLPTVVWAYPLDYTDPAAAGQVAAVPTEFTTVFGPSPVFFALAGYAVLDDVAMPVVGPSETAYDTFVEQIVANAKAAIDKAVELGVTDPDRVGVMGHSHGALMTANLLAWSDLFRAGIARSGAYNHTLRPFGFQNERRTLYKAQATYIKLSPLLHADQIDEPLLIIHGQLDVNPGTVPMQSEKLFEAIRGVGGTARLVMLPYEWHGYQGLESVEHTVAEQLAWFDRYVKDAKPRAKKP